LLPADYFRRLARAEIFPDTAPLEIDLGCGDGTFLLEMARAFPERRFLGVERLLGRVRKVSRRLHQAGLANARVLRLESRYTVEWLLPPGCAARLHLLCPDPWPKARHHRRRLVQDGFLAAAWRALEPGGELLVKTDDPDYHAWTLEQVARGDRFEPVAWPEHAFFHPCTDFERQWLDAGRTIHRLRLRRKNRTADEDFQTNPAAGVVIKP
jgi:tRNA (guanine-N7-)-methyltransferase